MSGGASSAGVAVDISEGGLAVRTDSEVRQGEAVEVQLNVPGKGIIGVEALVWHVRCARNRKTGESVYLLGLVLSKAPDVYFDLAAGSKPKPMRAPPPDLPILDDGLITEPTDLSPYRVRLKHRASPRTRVLCVDAASDDEAREIAREEFGDAWEILEARASKSS